MNLAQVFTLGTIAFGMAVALYGIFFYRSHFADRASNKQKEVVAGFHAAVQANRALIKPLRVTHHDK